MEPSSFPAESHAFFFEGEAAAPGHQSVRRPEPAHPERPVLFDHPLVLLVFPDGEPVPAHQAEGEYDEFFNDFPFVHLDIKVAPELVEIKFHLVFFRGAHFKLKLHVSPIPGTSRAAINR
jgi:hypothetical protein